MSKYSDTIKMVIEYMGKGESHFRHGFDFTADDERNILEALQACEAGRLLPEDFACAELADGKSVAVFYPEGKNVFTEKRQLFTVSNNTKEET
ncbi:MAG: hypothetical protein WC455_23470 [Dehalococcoidia bacterium]|jgi:acyl transferase domain-containing protein